MAKRRYNQFCPVARTLDVVGERWTLLIVRDLMRGPCRYTDLRNGLPGMASNLLAHRLGALEAAGLVGREHRTDPEPRDVYVLTERGEELRPVLLALGRFGLGYLDLPTDDEPMHREMFPEGLATMMLTEEFPDGAFSVHFALDEGDYTMRIADAGPVGRRRPAAERLTVLEGLTEGAAERADVTIIGSMLALLLVRRGEMTAAEAIDQGLLRVDGSDGPSATLGRLLGFEQIRV